MNYKINSLLSYDEHAKQFAQLWWTCQVRIIHHGGEGGEEWETALPPPWAHGQRPVLRILLLVVKTFERVFLEFVAGPLENVKTWQKLFPAHEKKTTLPGLRRVFEFYPLTLGKEAAWKNDSGQDLSEQAMAKSQEQLSNRTIGLPSDRNQTQTTENAQVVLFHLV